MADGNLSVQGVQAGHVAPESAQQPHGSKPEVSQPVRSPHHEPALREEDFSPEQLRNIASAFGQAVGLINHGISVRVDDSSNRVITQVVNTDTGEVIRQVPPQEMLEIAHRLRQFVGTLFDLEG
jgi:flagellar protein FlaG